MPKPAAATPTKVLVVGNLHDPATPYQGAKDLTSDLGNAELLSWDGEGHTSYLQRQLVHRRLRQRLPDRAALLPPEHDLPAVMAEPKLIVADAERRRCAASPSCCTAAGRESHRPVRAHQLAVLRMRPFVASLRRHGGRDGLVVAQLRYRVRGWNGADRSPVADAAWALDRLIATASRTCPSALVGHSMGGRTAMYVAGHESVRAVVGLAPWIEAGDPVDRLAGDAGC